MKRIIPILFAFISCTFLHAQQNPTKEKIAGSIADYFELDRESIHAHFDKSVFFTNEQIWFKGYAFNKKNDTPFFETTNVFATLYDDAGKQLDEQLLFSYLGAFSGNFKLSDKMSSGLYHIRFYTNWMNNFSENESSTYTVQVLNLSDTKMADYQSPDYSKINISIQPEGGNFVEGIVNNISIGVTDCNGRPIEAKEGKIVNSKGETAANFIVGKSGFGKVYLTPTDETYKVVFAIDNRTVEASLPKATMNGLALEVNNYALPGKTILKLRTHTRSLSSLAKKPLFIVISQNNRSNIIETGFVDQPEKELVITNDNLYKGVNAIRVIDADLRLLAERYVFEYPDIHSEVSFPMMNKENGNIKLYGISNFPNADISISVVPENSLATNSGNDICSDLLINPYFTTKAHEVSQLLNLQTKAKRYELDLFLLNQQTGKYSWQDILSGQSKPTYNFDIGLSVKGTINQPLPDPRKYRMQLSSPLSLINDFSAINEKNEFEFKNLVFGNLANFRFTLLKNPSVPTDMKFYHQILNRRRPFNKPLEIKPRECSENRMVPISLPQFGKDVVALENVDVVGKPKNELKYRNKYGNASLKGYKVTEMDNGDLLSFIRANGFNVTRSMGDVVITGRQVTTINGQQSSPDVYINGRQLTTFDELDYIRMFEVDEIYLNPNAIVPSIQNKMGVIRIYMKKMDFGNAKTQTQTFEIKEGFAKMIPFENVPLSSTKDKGFQDFGIIQWIPTVLTDDKGEFSFEIPRTGLKTVKIIIEGFTPDGRIISETKTIVVE